MRKVYYQDSTIIFTAEKPTDGVPVWDANGTDQMSIAKMLEKLGNSKRMAVKDSDPEEAFLRFLSLFRLVDAAGGIVKDTGGRILMIFRNGRWDLPKGHAEAGEEMNVCAAREVAEETRVECAIPEKLLTTTYHFYQLHGEWIMKRTHWWEMSGGNCEPEPQTEEGITEVRWVEPDEAAILSQGSFASIKAVLEAEAAAQKVSTSAEESAAHPS